MQLFARQKWGHPVKTNSPVRLALLHTTRSDYIIRTWTQIVLKYVSVSYTVIIDHAALAIVCSFVIGVELESTTPVICSNPLRFARWLESLR